MKIRDSFATLNGDNTTHEMPSGGLEIVADDGRYLFAITLLPSGSIQVRTGAICKHGERVLNTTLVIKSVSSNVIEVFREEYPA